MLPSIARTSEVLILPSPLKSAAALCASVNVAEPVIAARMIRESLVVTLPSSLRSPGVTAEGGQNARGVTVSQSGMGNAGAY